MLTASVWVIPGSLIVEDVIEPFVLTVLPETVAVMPAAASVALALIAAAIACA